MFARDIMTPDPVTILTDADLKQAARIMIERRVSALPVVNNKEQVVGILSEGDLLWRTEISTEKKRSGWLEFFLSTDQLARDYVKSHGVKVGEVMTRPVLSVAEDTSLVEIADLFERHGIKRVPVLKDGKLIGIVSRADIVRAYAEGQSVPQPPMSQDRRIREALLADIKREAWSRTLYLSISIHDGIVELSGVVESDERRNAVIVMAERIPGVQRVIDQLTVMPILPILGP